MSKVSVLYYSAYGHIEAMANAVAEGAREAGGDSDQKMLLVGYTLEMGNEKAQGSIYDSTGCMGMIGRPRQDPLERFTEDRT